MAFHLLPRPGGGTKKAGDGEPKPTSPSIPPQPPSRPNGGRRTSGKGSKGKWRGRRGPRAHPMPKETSVTNARIKIYPWLQSSQTRPRDATKGFMSIAKKLAQRPTRLANMQIA